MTVMVGDVASTDEVRARWAYGEMVSERWGPHYNNSNLKQKAIQQVPFCTLSDEERRQLARDLGQVRPRSFTGVLDRSAHYVCEAWNPDQLLQTWAIPTFDQAQQQCIPYRQFWTSGPRQDPRGNPDPSDPRARALPPGRFAAVEPVIVVELPRGDLALRRGGLVLLEGYGRSLHFMRDRDQGASLLVWRPH
jgi:hypothetical protein